MKMSKDNVNMNSVPVVEVQTTYITNEPKVITEVGKTLTNTLTAHRAKGQKFDSGKLQWHLLDMSLLEDTVKVLMVGAKKYSPNNWQLVEDAKERYYNAAMRHLTAWKRGEKLDPDDRLPHLAHLMCNVIFLTYFDKKRKHRG